MLCFESKYEMSWEMLIILSVNSEIALLMASDWKNESLETIHISLTNPFTRNPALSLCASQWRKSPWAQDYNTSLKLNMPQLKVGKFNTNSGIQNILKSKLSVSVILHRFIFL